MSQDEIKRAIRDEEGILQNRIHERINASQGSISTQVLKLLRKKEIKRERVGSGEYKGLYRLFSNKEEGT